MARAYQGAIRVCDHSARSSWPPLFLALACFGRAPMAVTADCIAAYSLVGDDDRRWGELLVSYTGVMMRKTASLLAMVLVALLVGGITSRMFASQSGRPLPDTTSKTEPPPAPVDQPSVWEYHIVSSQSQPYNPNQKLLPPMTYLDHRINELAEQGWEVQSINAVPWPGYTEVFAMALLRRPRK